MAGAVAVAHGRGGGGSWSYGSGEKMDAGAKGGERGDQQPLIGGHKVERAVGLGR